MTHTRFVIDCHVLNNTLVLSLLIGLVMALNLMSPSFAMAPVPEMSQDTPSVAPRIEWRQPVMTAKPSLATHRLRRHVKTARSVSVAKQSPKRAVVRPTLKRLSHKSPMSPQLAATPVKPKATITPKLTPKPPIAKAVAQTVSPLAVGGAVTSKPLPETLPKPIPVQDEVITGTALDETSSASAAPLGFANAPERVAQDTASLDADGVLVYPNAIGKTPSTDPDKTTEDFAEPNLPLDNLVRSAPDSNVSQGTVMRVVVSLVAVLAMMAWLARAILPKMKPTLTQMLNTSESNAQGEIAPGVSPLSATTLLGVGLSALWKKSPPVQPIALDDIAPLDPIVPWATAPAVAGANPLPDFSANLPRPDASPVVSPLAKTAPKAVPRFTFDAVLAAPTALTLAPKSTASSEALPVQALQADEVMPLEIDLPAERFPGGGSLRLSELQNLPVVLVQDAFHPVPHVLGSVSATGLWLGQLQNSNEAALLEYAQAVWGPVTHWKTHLASAMAVSTPRQEPTGVPEVNASKLMLQANQQAASPAQQQLTPRVASVMEQVLPFARVFQSYNTPPQATQRPPVGTLPYPTSAPTLPKKPTPMPVAQLPYRAPQPQQATPTIVTHDQAVSDILDELLGQKYGPASEPQAVPSPLPPKRAGILTPLPSASQQLDSADEAMTTDAPMPWWPDDPTPVKPFASPARNHSPLVSSSPVEESREPTIKPMSVSTGPVFKVLATQIQSPADTDA